MADSRDSSDAEEPASLSDPPDVIDEDLPVSFRYGEGDLIAGKYLLTRSLGKGGMGEVWKAHSQVLDVDVALKLLRSDVENPIGGDRLLREARAAARLGDPAIVRIFDFGTAEGGEPFIVMELLEGEDLASRLDRHGRVSATKAVRTILPIAHALAAAHGKGIVHRDIKPENVFLARIEGEYVQPKIVDFGIAQLDHSKNLRLTRTGSLLGTPSYMSPEQARGEDTDHRVDIWALCVVLYEMITGRLPFEGKNSNAVLHAIIMNEPPPITTFEVGDAELWAVLSRGLAKKPDDRFRSMQELGEALGRWLLSKNVTEDLAGAAIATTWLRGRVAKSSAPPPPGMPVPSLASASRDPTTRSLRAEGSRRKGILALSAAAVFVLAALVGLRRGPDPAETTAAPHEALPIVAPATKSPEIEPTRTAPSATTTLPPGEGPGVPSKNPTATRPEPRPSARSPSRPADRGPKRSGSAARGGSSGAGSGAAGAGAPGRVLKNPFK